MNSASTIEKSSERAKLSASTLDPGSREKVRRTRGATPVKRSETPKMKSNGHDTSATNVNGHGQASPSRTAQEKEAPLEKSRAASDDARDFPTAAAASSAAAGKERDACAEVAQAPEGEKYSQPKKSRKKAGTGTSRAPSDKDTSNGKNNDTNENENMSGAKDTEELVHIPPGSEPLPEDGLGFVDAIHEHVDLYLACARLVRSKDPKISQRMVERLLEMSYTKAPAAVDDQTPQIIFDAPRPVRD